MSARDFAAHQITRAKDPQRAGGGMQSWKMFLRWWNHTWESKLARPMLCVGGDDLLFPSQMSV